MAVEASSHFILVEPTLDVKAETVCDFIFKRIFCMFSMPEIIFTDRGPGFKNRMLSTMNGLLGVSTKHSLAYHSQGNGLAEAAVKKVETTLRHYVDVDGADWSTFLYSTQLDLNTTCHRTIGESPYFILFSRDPVLPIDI